MIKTYTYHGPKSGAHVLIFGAIHGNEPCGQKAIEKFIQQLEAKEITLMQGTLTLIPICNPQAFVENKRHIDANLNRVFTPHSQPKNYEEKLANILTEYVQRCDMLLDLHSFTSKGMPFVFQDNSLATELAEATQIPFIVEGWPDLYPPNANENDTASSAIGLGKPAAVVECGHHEAGDAPEYAYQAIINVLHYAGLIKMSAVSKQLVKNVRMVEVYNREYDGAFTQDWQNGDAVKQGDVIARYINKTEVKAPQDGYLIMPMESAELGDEWFYFAE